MEIVIQNNFALVQLFTMFIIKHFIVDFVLQRKYQYSNKHIYGHPGGLIHAGLHGVSTFLIVLWLVEDRTLIDFVILGFIDFVLHYHIDWTKSNLNKKYNLNAQTESFWILLGLDQTFHFLTYVLIIYLSVI
jgi:hypothetical protein